MKAPGITANGGMPLWRLAVGIGSFLALGMVWSPQGSWGKELSPKGSGYAVENWQMEEGLPQISITSIAQTADGYLWLGTFNGLARFDDVRSVVIGRVNALGIGRRNRVEILATLDELRRKRGAR